MNLIGPYILIISEGVKKNASDVFNILDPDSGGANTFTVPLNASGDPLQPIDFWGAYTMLEPSTVTALTTGQPTDYPSQACHYVFGLIDITPGTQTHQMIDALMGHAVWGPYEIAVGSTADVRPVLRFG